MYSLGIDIAGITVTSAVALARFDSKTRKIECALLKNLPRKWAIQRLSGIDKDKVFDTLTIDDVRENHWRSIDNDLTYVGEKLKCKSIHRTLRLLLMLS